MPGPIAYGNVSIRSNKEGDSIQKIGTIPTEEQALFAFAKDVQFNGPPTKTECLNGGCGEEFQFLPNFTLTKGEIAQANKMNLDLIMRL